MIDIAKEKILTQRQACEFLPPRRAGRRTHPTTISRWMDVGVNGVRLEEIRIGKNRCTSLEALQRFFERLGAAPPNT